MMGIDGRALRVIWTTFLFGLTLAVLYAIRSTVVVFALAIFFAYMLWPLVELAQRFLPRSRSWALAFVYVVFVGALVLVGFELIPALGSEATNFGTHLPRMLAGNKLATIPLPTWLEPLRDQVISFLSREASNLGSRVVPFVQELGTKILTGLSDVLPLILIPILAFFFIKDGDKIRVNLLGAVDDRRERSLLERILDDTHVMLRNYIRALVLLAVASFISWIIFLSAMHYPYELLLAGISGLLEFIPVIGPAAAGIIVLVVCGVAGSGSLLWIIIFWGAYRVFADYVLNPFLMSSGVELHPLLVLFGVLAGESVAGVPGMFFSVPVIAILRVIYSNLKHDYNRNRPTMNAAKPQTASNAENTRLTPIEPVAK